MIAFWFMPYALATGNTVIVKPSERVPLTMQKVFGILEQLDLPAGVVNLVNGAKESVDAILDHPFIRSVSFVGSTAVARYVYSRATANGKRAQCQGGAKNPIVILPDADNGHHSSHCRRQCVWLRRHRCLAASLAITVGGAGPNFTELIADAAVSRKVGNGLEDGIQMGPVITMQSKDRIQGLIGQSVQAGSTALVDGRNPSVAGYEQGSFVRPTILTDVHPESDIARPKSLVPFLGLIQAR